MDATARIPALLIVFMLIGKKLIVSFTLYVVGSNTY